MNPSSAATLFATGGALVAILVWAAIVVALCIGPFAVISSARSLRKIARELERANDYREHYEHGVRSGPLGI